MIWDDTPGSVRAIQMARLGLFQTTKDLFYCKEVSWLFYTKVSFKVQNCTQNCISLIMQVAFIIKDSCKLPCFT